MPDPAIRAVIGLPPTDTVRAFEARDTLRATVRWAEMWQDEHARAFTVAKVANLDLLGEIQASLADMLANGGTFEQWQANLVPYLQKQGWWGEVQDQALTGTHDVVQVGSRRLRTIYDTNLRVSRAAGRWKRIQELKDVRPFLRYTAVMDARTRPEHRRWHGTILPADDPWWDTHFPPCGWYCRCTVRQLSQREMDRKGWKVTPPPADGPPRRFVRPDGQAVEVPEGISPGFAYNPGKASMRAVADKAIASLERAAPHDLAAARETLDTLTQSDAFLETLRDPAGIVAIGVLDDRIAGIVAATARVVVMSSYTFSKQLGQEQSSAGHAELTVADYRRLPSLFAAPQRLFSDRPGRDNEFVVMGKVDGRLYRAAFKVLRDKQEIFLTSFRGARAADRLRDAKWPDLLESDAR